jgi:hypothetical protein
MGTFPLPPHAQCPTSINVLEIDVAAMSLIHRLAFFHKQHFMIVEDDSSDISWQNILSKSLAAVF